MEFFENHVFTSMFKQSIHEGELSRLASRARAMEAAIVNIEKTEASLKSESRKIKKQADNKKRLESIAGMAFWS
jgi:F0F1-type ATP synthase gamma subunit